MSTYTPFVVQYISNYVQSGMNRSDVDIRVCGDQALDMTVDDLAVLDRDYFTVPEEDIKNIEVMMTIEGGRVVWEKERSS